MSFTPGARFEGILKLVFFRRELIGGLFGREGSTGRCVDVWTCDIFSLRRDSCGDLRCRGGRGGEGTFPN